MAPTRTFPPVISASRWGTAWQSAFSSALSKRGRATNADGTLTPRLTNGEALELLWSWHLTGGRDAFPLYGQYAAVCYGWTPDNGVMDIRPAQRDALMGIEDTAALWLALFDSAGELDAKRPVVRPVLRLDHGFFDDAIVQGAVAEELKNDGADSITFRIKGDTTVPPTNITKPKPKPKTKTPLWMQVTLVYIGYRVIKNMTGGPKYAGD